MSIYVHTQMEAHGSSGLDLTAAAAPSLDETQPAIPYSVNAANRGNGGRGRRPGRGQNRGNRGGRGGRQNNQNQNQNQNNDKWPTAKHEDVPNKGDYCFNHHTYGRKAFHCTDPLSCSWANIPPHPRPKPVTK